MKFNLHPCCFHADVILVVLMFVISQEPSQKAVTQLSGVSKTVRKVYGKAFFEHL